MATATVLNSASVVRVLIVADVRLYREGLAAGLATHRQLVVVGTTGTGADARAKATEQRPDVVLVDMAIRESLQLIRELKSGGVPAKVLAFAVEETTSDIFDCAEAGAAGYVTADASMDDLVDAIERIGRGELVCSPRVAAQLFRRMAERPARQPMDALSSKWLTIRERQVLDGIRLGHSNKEIAHELHIAEPTVKNHVHHLLEKLDVTTRAQAAARAARPGGRRRLSSAAAGGRTAD